MSREPAKSKTLPKPEETAGAILAWLANEPEMMSRFLALSGVQVSQLRQAVEDPGFLSGMIDFIMSHEPTLMDFCKASDWQPEAVVSAAHYYCSPGLDSGEF